MLDPSLRKKKKQQWHYLTQSLPNCIISKVDVIEQLEFANWEAAVQHFRYYDTATPPYE